VSIVVCGGVARVLTCCVFFSSRRRHTRLVSDWSSDVCSSDLSWRPFRTTRTTPPVSVGTSAAPGCCARLIAPPNWRGHVRYAVQIGRASGRERGGNVGGGG